MLTEHSLRERVAVLRGIDVTLLLKTVLPEIEAVIQAPRLERASEMISVWESALGGDLNELRGLIDQVRGQTGYIRALAAFSRTQEYRAVGIRHFAQGVFLGSRVTLDRWSWVPALYRCRIEEFALQRDLRIRNGELAFTIAGRMKESSVKRLRVLREVMDSYRVVRDRFADAPVVHAKAFSRMGEVLDEAQRLANDSRLELQERDLVRERVAPSALDRSTLSRIARLPSVRAQTSAYQALVAEAEHRTNQRKAHEEASRLNGELRGFSNDTSQQSIDQLLTSLAGQLHLPT